MGLLGLEINYCFSGYNRVMQKYVVSFEVDENTHKELVNFLKDKTVEAFIEQHLNAVLQAVTDKKPSTVNIVKESVEKEVAKIKVSLFKKIIGW